MRLSNVTPFRQLSRAYGALLSASNSLSVIAQHKSMLGASINGRQEHDGQELARIVAEAIKPPMKDFDIYERLGLRLLLDKASAVDRTLIDHHAYEPEQVAFFIGSMSRFMGDPNVVFLDVGAFWGLYALLATRAGARKVYAFEADRYNYSQLQAQLFLNNATHEVTAFNKAVSSGKAMLKFWDSRDHPSGNRGGVGIVDKNFNRPTYDVETTALDDVIDLRDRLIWIKLDVEGHEAQALRGMRNLIENNQVFMQVEIFDENKEPALAELEKLNLRKVHEIYPDRYYTNMKDSRFPY